MTHPRRVWQHAFEDRSESQLSDTFQSVGWVVERLRRDYGEDLFARPFSGGHPTGQEFFIQLKGTDKISQYYSTKGKSLSYPVHLANLSQWFSYTLPVIFIVWDITSKVGYWVHVQPFIKDKLEIDPYWLQNRSRSKEPTRKIHIPRNQTISENDLGSLQQTIDIEWRKIKQGKNFFEIIYRASADLSDNTLNKELPKTIKQQLRITELQAVVIAKPNDVRGWLDLASVHYEMGNLTEALKAINKAWALDTNDFHVRQTRACILAEFAIENGGQSSMLHEAIALFQSTRKENNDPLADYNIGNSYSELGQFQIAIDHYDRALSAGPTSQQAAQIWTNRGNAIDRVGTAQDAEESYRNAIKLNPYLWNAHASWAALEVRKGNFQEASKHFHDALQCNNELLSSGDRIIYWYAYSLHQIGEFKEALNIINHLLTVNPVHKESLLLKAHLLYKLYQKDKSNAAESLSFFKDRLIDDPTDILARDMLNHIYLDQGLATERYKLLQETATLDDPPALALYDYALLLEDEHNITMAVNYLEKAAEKDQRHLIVHKLARLEYELGQYSKAITYYEMSLIGVKNPLPILRKMVDCYHSLDDHEGCVVIISKALLIDASTQSWWNNLHIALQKLGIEPQQFTEFLNQKISNGETVSELEIRSKLDSLKGRSA